MSKKNTLTQESEKRINMKYLPQWNDDNMSSLSDNDPTEEHNPLWPEETPLDANMIEDYNDLSEVPVYDYLGREIGVKSVPRKRKSAK